MYSYTWHSYEGNVHQQVHGTAMGSPVHVSVVVANLVMEEMKQKASINFPHLPAVWEVKVDDMYTSTSIALLERADTRKRTMDILEKGWGKRSCTRQPPEPQYARALVLGAPASPLAAILKHGYQPVTLQGRTSGDRMQEATEVCIRFSCSKVGLCCKRS